MYKELEKIIKSYNRIIIHRHFRPDGDAIGSQMGLKEVLLTNYPGKEVYAVGDENDLYTFIGRVDNINDELYNGSLVIVVDTGSEELISDLRYKKGDYLIKIDHHASGSSYADLNLVDTSEISCASLLAKIFYSLGLEVNKKAAYALFAGIVSDSNRFFYQGVNDKTFELASKLVSTGIDIQEIYRYLYTEDYDFVRLKAQFILSINKTKNGVAYIKTTYEEFKKYNMDFFLISRGLVSTMSGIKGIDIWVNFTEDQFGKVHAELRSTKYNINPIAVKYGGGGHRLASGAVLKGFEDADKMLEDLDQLIMEDKNGR